MPHLYAGVRGGGMPHFLTFVGGWTGFRRVLAKFPMRRVGGFEDGWSGCDKNP
jgi:hypothetical protein